MDEIKNKIGKGFVCGAVVGVWLSGLTGWLGTVAVVPFVAGVCMWVWRQ